MLGWGELRQEAEMVRADVHAGGSQKHRDEAPLSRQDGSPSTPMSPLPTGGEVRTMLHEMASQGDLLNYLTVFRLLRRVFRTRPAAREQVACLGLVADMLVEHLQICYNCFPCQLIDWSEDVEHTLDWLVGRLEDHRSDNDRMSERQVEQVAETIGMAATIYYSFVKTQ